MIELICDRIWIQRWTCPPVELRREHLMVMVEGGRITGLGLSESESHAARQMWCGEMVEA